MGTLYAITVYLIISSKLPLQIVVDILKFSNELLIYGKI